VANKEVCLVEQFWNRLKDKEVNLGVLEWSKQSRDIQDAFIASVNHYSMSNDYTPAYYVMQNARKLA